MRFRCRHIIRCKVKSMRKIILSIIECWLPVLSRERDAVERHRLAKSTQLRLRNFPRIIPLTGHSQGCRPFKWKVFNVQREKYQRLRKISSNLFSFPSKRKVPPSCFCSWCTPSTQGSAEENWNKLTYFPKLSTPVQFRKGFFFSETLRLVKNNNL